MKIIKIDLCNYKGFLRCSVNLSDRNVLVGPNNCGKSTLIGSLRVLEVALKKAYSKSPSLIQDLKGDKILGYTFNADHCPISLENVKYNYSDEKCHIKFIFDNKVAIVIYFDDTRVPKFYVEGDVKIPRSPSDFKKLVNFKMMVVPVLGPIEHNEDLVSIETVNQNLNSHRASRNFRNYWHYNPMEFNQFAKLLSETWPGLTIEKPELSSNKLIMMCIENRIPRELYWAGFGFQIWCQILTHYSRLSGYNLFVIDEPEVYLHSEIQRQFIKLLCSQDKPFCIATHSSEILAQSQPNEIILIDKSAKLSKRLQDEDGVQNVIDLMGSVHSFKMVRLAKLKRIITFEDYEDLITLNRFAEKVGKTQAKDGENVIVLKSNGFSSWPKIGALSWGLAEIVSKNIKIFSIYDRDYYAQEYIAEIESQITRQGGAVHFLERKEMENYLINVNAIHRSIPSNLNVSLENVAEIIRNAINNYKNDLLGQYIAKEAESKKAKGIDMASLSTQMISKIDKIWPDLDKAIAICPGKKVLSAIRNEIQMKFKITLTNKKIINSFRPEEIKGDLLTLINKIESFILTPYP